LRRAARRAIVAAMLRPVLASLLLVTTVACGKKSDDSAKRDDVPAPTGSAGSAGSAEPVAPRPPPPPLPELVADPGGATGEPVWVTGFGGMATDTIRGVASDADGTTYVTGLFEGEATFGALGTRTPVGEDPKKLEPDAFVLAVKPDGTPAWLHTFGAARADTGNSVAVGPAGVAVVGSFLDAIDIGGMKNKSSGSDDLYVAGFGRDGTPKWVLVGGGVDTDGANTIAAADDGWVVGGSFSKGVPPQEWANLDKVQIKSQGKTDAFLARLGPDGDVLWVKTFGGPSEDTIYRVAVDPQGSIFVLGTFIYEATWGGDKLKAAGNSDTDIVLAKYDRDGNHVWSKRFGNAFNDVAGGLAVDPAGNVTFTGSYDQSITLGETEYAAKGESDIVVARFTGGGDLIWARTYGADREDVGYGVAADAAGNTVVTGWFQNRVDFGAGPVASHGNKDVFVLKLDPNGAPIWVKTFGNKDHDQARAIALDGQGNPTVAGIFRFTLALPPAKAIESVRKPDDKAPKPDAFVARFKR
jgi:hypothetical protein